MFISFPMNVLEFSLSLFIIIICFTYSTWYLTSRWCKTSVPTNWPLIGMLPGLIQNAHRVHEFATDVLIETMGTVEFHGPVLANLNMLITSDPANIHHILSRNFSNYPKGLEYRKIFDILGNGIFNVDYELWEIHRKTTMSLTSHPKFQILLERNTWDTIEKGLLPILDDFARQGTPFDLQDIFQRYSFDAIIKLLLDHNPRSLSIGLPHVPCEKAFNDAMYAIFYRHILPEICWKLQKWLQIGKEKKLIQAQEAFDQFLYPRISRKQQELMNKVIKDKDFDIFAAYVQAYYQWNNRDSSNIQEFLRDTFLSLIFAGRDTTSTTLTWLFWLLAKNPLAETRIRKEIQKQLHPIKEDDNLKFFNVEESRKLVYLHGALCEALRLFPPVSIEHKVPLDYDILPSGHRVSPNTRIVLSFYTMGRIESIWGKDCLEFKPERWISELGKIKPEPSFKFPAFNAGPRTCLGREMGFIQMKMVAATIIQNYHVQLMEAQTISPSDSIVLQMKNGLKVRLVNRVPLRSS
ncbi:PREDICTED: alkane hydroxylase MAH1-like [Nicotiana attenuata]|uniref:Alkane hydroxylase mah1 n=1 Tax=Nicotiana attenuata TaxID=49451 RepID=A0A1J6HY61_NICAT|nr:PREDICTED: alkane hydroxylase MAH1-like [Nicotiana attenuata]OIS97781.1 alkane hydroxylase mah1 [Nicotiana attenuata]